MDAPIFQAGKILLLGAKSAKYQYAAETIQERDSILNYYDSLLIARRVPPCPRKLPRFQRHMIVKQTPEDFRVEELTAARPAVSGPFALYRLEKSGWTTPDAL